MGLGLDTIPDKELRDCWASCLLFQTHPHPWCTGDEAMAAVALCPFPISQPLPPLPWVPLLGPSPFRD